jgi:hypothetical protein
MIMPLFGRGWQRVQSLDDSFAGGSSSATESRHLIRIKEYLVQLFRESSKRGQGQSRKPMSAQEQVLEAPNTKGKRGHMEIIKKMKQVAHGRRDGMKHALFHILCTEPEALLAGEADQHEV